MFVEIRAAPAALAGFTWAATRRSLVVLSLLSAALVPSRGRSDPPLEVDLATALALARKNNPALEAARRRIAEAHGGLTQASVLLAENPELELGAGPRFLDDPAVGSRLGLEAGLSQRIEIAGQRGHRIERTAKELAAAASDADAAAQTLDLAVATGFFQALAALERARIAEEHEALARELLDIARARFDRGAASPVEANGARIRVAEATRQLLKARGEAAAARVRLVPLLGTSADQPLSVTGSLSARTTTSPAGLASAAREKRPELVAAARRVQAARAASELADASAWPDIRIGARFTTEEASRTLLGTVAVPIPLFQRNQGERERARATVSRLEAEERGVRADVEAQVRGAKLDLERALRTLALYDDEVLKALEENLGLLKRMLEAGKVAPGEVIVLQRELLDGRLGYVEARAELAIADARARTAAGLTIEGTEGGGR